MTFPSVDSIIKFGPVIFGLFSFFALSICKLVRKKKMNIGDLLVVGLSGSAVPTGFMLIWGAFDNTIVPQLSDAGVYIAFAGAALLIIFGQTFREKFD